MDTLRTQGKMRIGVDMYVLLHWAFSKHPEVHESLTKDPKSYHKSVLEDILNYLLTFYKCGFYLYLVYDGRTTPFKVAEKDRKERREKAKEDHKWSMAYEVEPVQASYIWKMVAKYPEIKQVVAPFEADPQLAYMYYNSTIDVVLTCDSDLIFYGVDTIIFRTANGAKLFERIVIPDDDKARVNQLSLIRLLVLPFLIGNDYSKGVRGYGIVKSLKIANTVTIPEDEMGEVDWHRYFLNIYEMLDPKIVERYSLASFSREGYKKYVLQQFALILSAYTKYPVFDVNWVNDSVSLKSLKEVLPPVDVDGLDFTPLLSELDNKKWSDIAHCIIEPNTLTKY